MAQEQKQTYQTTSHKEEIWNSITHGIGVILGFVGLVLLILKGFEENNRAYTIAVLVYGITFIWTYTTSTVYHLFHNARVRVRNFLHLLDHTAIYLFIAGTYTPVALFALPELWDVGILIGIWSLAVLGILSKLFLLGKYKKLSLVFYLLMGWMIVVAVKPLIDFAPPALLYWLLAGGVCYSIGTIFFSLRKLKYSHAVWHLFVLAGSVCHFLGIYLHLQV